MINFPQRNWTDYGGEVKWADDVQTAIKELWNTSHKALMTEACIDLVKKKQMELPQLRKARTSIHTSVSVL
ncbi:uncharacterized protein METZ01_LOCUS122585 [marine metagenome]|uniref:Uncharacterized protein n=1 Tax=marine metagenome TaxID=408172 RepID=A0A381XZ79_9ZZZZ